MGGDVGIVEILEGGNGFRAIPASSHYLSFQ